MGNVNKMKSYKVTLVNHKGNCKRITVVACNEYDAMALAQKRVTVAACNEIAGTTKLTDAAIKAIKALGYAVSVVQDIKAL